MSKTRTPIKDLMVTYQEEGFYNLPQRDQARVRHKAIFSAMKTNIIHVPNGIHHACHDNMNRPINPHKGPAKP